ncbi:GlsB/YeaQ/YmgE family stress response membrane protein [Xanthobacter agilis]|uniref:Membrane protein YeaQ/YmgE (Transglycosylase-associated protein family) n=1 Tax=Xanthobacter agilis TaxID=47492 RepID=A0ABU0LC07_XANAG|nr:GlsB/YeaQ/YmgE family stress response membrane protein [Xanthobacter agilis]MDQ0504661.1 putative membrane protein YeaQ/YmgE (transglycosylase-associated protein family) [Xanthobacter agilis]
MGILWMIIIGAVAGFLAGQVFRGYGFGFVGNVAVGIVGALIGGFLFGNVFLVGGLVGQIISATVGAVILLFVISLVAR